MPNETRRQWIAELTAVLEGSTSPEELESAAGELTSSDDPEALDALAGFLRQAEFLDRLDEPDSSNRILHLNGVLRRLAEKPSAEVARVCLALVDEPIYLEHDRKSLVLETLAAVVPMNTETAEAFRRANDEGYFAFNALLLARNGSPVALELFRSMMGDKEVEVEERVEMLHRGILPHRTRLSILQMVGAILGDGLEEPVTVAAIESVFDYKTEWFSIHGPAPPAWRTASDDALRYLIDLGGRASARPNLPETLPPAIEETTEIARALLNRRKA